MGGVSLVIQSPPGCVNTKGTTLCVLPRPVSVRTLCIYTAPVLVTLLHATVQVLKLYLEAELCLIVSNFKSLVRKRHFF